MTKNNICENEKGDIKKICQNVKNVEQNTWFLYLIQYPRRIKHVWTNA